MVEPTVGTVGLAKRLRRATGKPFQWCKGVVVDTKEFAFKLAFHLKLPVDDVFVAIARQVLRSEALDKEPDRDFEPKEVFRR